MERVDNLAVLFIFALETGLYFWYCQNALEGKGSRWAALICMIVAQCLFRVTLALTGVFSLILSFLIDFILLCLFFRGTVAKKLFLTTMLYSFLFILDTVATVTVPLLAGMVTGRQRTVEEVYYLCVAVSKGLTALMIGILGKTFSTEARLRVWWTVLPVPLLTVTALILVHPHIHESELDNTGLMVMVCLFSLLLNLFLLAYVRRMWEKARLQERLAHAKEMESLHEAHFRELREAYRQIDKTAHDLKHHFDYLESAPDLSAVKDYIRTIRVRASNPFTYTGNLDMDTMLGAKAGEIDANGIALEVSGILPPVIDWLEPVDVSILLGNGLSNAVEATVKAGGGMIQADFSYSGEWLMMSIANPVSADAATKKEAGHGFGLENMMDSVKRYDGHMQTTIHGGVFTLDILLQKRKSG